MADIVKLHCIRLLDEYCNALRRELINLL